MIRGQAAKKLQQLMTPCNKYQPASFHGSASYCMEFIEDHASSVCAITLWMRRFNDAQETKAAQKANTRVKAFFQMQKRYLRFKVRNESKGLGHACKQRRFVGSISPPITKLKQIQNHKIASDCCCHTHRELFGLPDKLLECTTKLCHSWKLFPWKKKWLVDG